MRFPIFVTDFFFLLLAALSVVFAIIYPNVNNYAFSIIAAGLTVSMIKRSHDALTDFENALSTVENLVWKPLFFSTGSVLMKFRGEEFTYTSSAGFEKNGIIPVDYSLSVRTGIRKPLEIKGTQIPGNPEVSGDKKLFDKIKKETLDFDKKYGLSLLRVGEGVIRFSVCLGFSKEAIPKDKKLSDMSAFLKDYLQFASSVKKSLN